MVGALIILAVVLAVLGVIAWLSFTATVEDMEDLDDRLHDPETPTLRYRVPNGVDPALLRGTVLEAGYESTVDETPRNEVLRVECPPEQREELRAVIAHAPADNDRTAELEDTYGPVVFLDESRAA